MKTIVRSLLGLAILIGLAWGGLQIFTSFINQRYEALTRASEAALARRDAQAAARLALAAMQGRELAFPHFNNERATALLRDALMEGQAPLAEISTRQFPRFTPTGDVIPLNASIGSDGKRLMILHNEDRAEWTIDIYTLPSARLLRQFSRDASKSDDKAVSVVAGFSPDLSTTVYWRSDGLYFRDTDTDQPVLTDFMAPAGFNVSSVSNDRRFVSARDDEMLRIWDFSVTPARVTDIPFGAEGDADEFDITPGAKMAITGTFSFATGVSSRSVIELPSQKVKFSLTSNSPIDASFSQDGRYLVTSVITGETPDHRSWTTGSRIRDLATGRPIGPVLDFGFVEKVQTLFDGRIMEITTIGEARFFDLETARLVGTPVDLHAFMGDTNFTDTTAYAMDGSHVLMTYKLNPILSMSAKSLAGQACQRWGAESQLTLTEREMATSKARFRSDPCIGA